MPLQRPKTATIKILRQSQNQVSNKAQDQAQIMSRANPAHDSVALCLGPSWCRWTHCWAELA